MYYEGLAAPGKYSVATTLDWSDLLNLKVFDDEENSKIVAHFLSSSIRLVWLKSDIT